MLEFGLQYTIVQLKKYTLHACQTKFVRNVVYIHRRINLENTRFHKFLINFVVVKLGFFIP